VLSELVEEELGALVDRSHTMSASFQRRTNIPNSDTYRESKEIPTAMGIQCINATGAIEGEGLASSMVLRGLADYVASEDTVRPASIRFYVFNYIGPGRSGI
jgi:flap endonuclease-1